MDKIYLPNQYEALTPAEQEAAKKIPHQYGGTPYIQRRNAALRADVEIFPLSECGEIAIRTLKQKHPNYFRSVREENIYRLFYYYHERFEIIAHDCEEFDKFFYDMEAGRDIWKWTERMGELDSSYRFGDFEAILNLLLSPLREVKTEAKKMADRMEQHTRAIIAMVHFGQTDEERRDEWERQNRR